jgi:dTDP-4-amino-4,6-dideoxygalactose transaminase
LSRDAWKRYSESGFQPYDVVLPGWKYNMTDMQAALGIHQLRRIDENHVRRSQIWERYNAAFRDIAGLTVPAPFEDGTHARHLYTLLVDPDVIARDRFVEELRVRNIGAGVHFVSAHLHSFFQERLGTKRGDFPEAEYVSDRTVSIPLSSKLTDTDVEDVIYEVTDVMASAR